MNPLLLQWARARHNTDQLFQLVKPEHLYDRPIAERHRIIFYLGHLDTFDWNLLRQPLNLPAFNPSFDNLFAFGIDPIDGGLPTDQPSDWPTQHQIAAYTQQIRNQLDQALINTESHQLLLNVAIEHRWMHAETLAYMLHQLPLTNRNKLVQLQAPASQPFHPQTIQIPAGQARLGISDAATFGWDNEFQAHQTEVEAFSIDRYKVTNGQYLKFVQQGGYQNRNLWSQPAWQWQQQNQITHPAFWKPHEDQFIYRAFFEEIPMPLDWPVYVSHAEATAYANWADRRLPSEAEWHRAAQGAPIEPGYLDMQRWDPTPVNAFPSSRSHWGVEGLIANGWEWTSTKFAPLPGFVPFSFYHGYSAAFFDGNHHVLKGGSPRTEKCMLRPSFRNWFQPHYQFAYSAFRCAGSE